MSYNFQEVMPPQCPPAQAQPYERFPVFRLCFDQKISEKDFYNHHELGTIPKRPKKDLCGYFALSFNTTIEASAYVRDNFKEFKERKIVAGKIIKTNGAMVQKKDHINLWLYKNVNMVQSFPLPPEFILEGSENGGQEGTEFNT